MLSVGNNLYATDGKFFSKARNNPQESQKIPHKCRKIPLHMIEVSVSPFPHKMVSRLHQPQAVKLVPYIPALNYCVPRLSKTLC
jgi:hypothetical protein